jgi:hypothetical protein
VEGSNSKYHRLLLLLRHRCRWMKVEVEKSKCKNEMVEVESNNMIHHRRK